MKKRPGRTIITGIRLGEEANEAWTRISQRLRLSKRQSLEAILIKIDHLQDIGDFPSTYAELITSSNAARV